MIAQKKKPRRINFFVLSKFLVEYKKLKWNLKQEKTNKQTHRLVILIRQSCAKTKAQKPHPGLQVNSKQLVCFTLTF